MQKILDKVFPVKTAYAHCDIPCGIYDPHNAQMAAHTVIRMTQLLSELGEDGRETEHKLTRMTIVKEKHAAKVEREVVTLWADYFKDEHFKANPKLTSLVQEILKLTGKVRQEINPTAANELLTKTQELAEIFYKTKDRDSKRIKSVYPTEGEIVVPV